MRLFQLLLLLLGSLPLLGALRSGPFLHSPRSWSKSLTFQAAATSHDFQNGDNSNPWLNHGLLFSSFSDGLSLNVQAKAFLKQGLAKALLLEMCADTEDKVESSVVQSPCSGPNVALLDQLADVDAALEQIENHPDPMSIVADLMSSLPERSPTPLELRFVYIPAAMYALRPESTNTPGKQRQRARADGKKRRDRIVDFLENEIIPPSLQLAVRAVTVDFDDGSVKQPQGPTSLGGGRKHEFPSNGKEAFADWKPHLIYVEGGNTFWLEHCVDKGNWGDLLTKAATSPTTVYCGSSAGAILVGKCVETACWKGWDDPRIHPDRPDRHDWVGVPGLNLLGGTSIFPHMDESWAPLVEEKKQSFPHDVVCLQDEDVLCVNGGAKSTKLASWSPGREEMTVAEEQLFSSRQ